MNKKNEKKLKKKEPEARSKCHHYIKRLAYLVTKHLSTSSCLQTNSMKRGDVILGEERKESHKDGMKKTVKAH